MWGKKPASQKGGWKKKKNTWTIPSDAILETIHGIQRKSVSKGANLQGLKQQTEKRTDAQLIEVGVHPQ